MSDNTFAQTPSNSETRQVIDDEQLKRIMKEQEPSFFEKYGHCFITLCIIALTTLVYGIEVIASGFSSSISSKVLFDMGAMFVPAIVSPIDCYRFIVPMFLHVDLMHLLFNMAALYSAGVILERLLGRWNFLLLYFIAGISGNVLCYAVDVYTGTYYLSAGASTSIFGLFVALALLGILSKRNRSFFTQYSKGMLSVIAINVLYTFLAPSISIAGHLGGALGGLLGMLIVPSKNLRVPVVVRVVVGLVWIVLIGYVLATSYIQWG